ncbi:hypothetical protein HET65_29760, partial [Streptomyces sp. McG5]|nr:hypothetical protein [Streptomyces sp. McG5]
MHPGDGSSPLLPGTTGDPAGPAPAAPWGGYQGQEQQWGGRQPGTAQQPGAYGTGQAPSWDSAPQPPQGYGYPPPQQAGPPQGYGYPPPQQAGPPQGYGYPPPHGQPPPPYGSGAPAQGPQGAGPLPPTQPPAGDQDATQFIAPVPPAQPQPYDEGATQYIPPVPGNPAGAGPLPGALPPEAPSGAAHHPGTGGHAQPCLLYKSDAADELECV